VHARALAGGRIEATAADLGQQDRFELDDVRRASGWRALVRGAAAELLRAGVPLRGARLLIAGDLPRGAGLASSAALEVATAIALIALTDAKELDLDLDRLEVAKICVRIEQRWGGAQTGMLDQLASLLGRPGSALRIDFRSLDVRPVALELGDFKLVTLHSGERRTNASSGYNQRRAECARACGLLGVGSLREVTLGRLDRLPAPLDRRARHVITENERVDGAVTALGRGDLDELGALLDASHASLRDRYEVCTPAVQAAVERLHGGGALGARLIGGGFGGHVLGLLPPDVNVPEGAREVRPRGGARMVDSG